MRLSLISVMTLLWMAILVLTHRPEVSHASQAATPVLVELFTSEGCSSCPPADRFLQKLDEQPPAGTEMIVLSEHVDYWNHIGWTDPYSASFYSERQSGYARRFGLDSVYTPQIVVDGTSQFVGSDYGLADKVFAKAATTAKLPVRLSKVFADASNVLHAHLETGTFDAALGSREAEVYFALALNRAESQVSAGENAGHKLSHVAVVRKLSKVGALRLGQTLTQDVQLKLVPGSDPRNLRLIAFVQEPRQGRVLGAAMSTVSAQ